MHDDISGYLTITNLQKRGQNVVNQTNRSSLLNHHPHIIGGTAIVSVKAPDELARWVYVTNLSQHFGLTNDEGNVTASIRHTDVHGVILNQLTGKHCVLSCFLRYIKIQPVIYLPTLHILN